MIKTYRKTDTIRAERFDGSDVMVTKYELDYEYDKRGDRHYYGGDIVELMIGDWIVTTIDGLHWTIKDYAFRKQYAELPVIPKYVADWIEECKNDGISIGDMLCSERRPEKMRDWMALTPGTYNFDQQRYSEHQDIVARAWLDGYQVEGDK